MNPQDITNITVYHDLLLVLQERGYTDLEATEILMKLSAQVELEVVEAVMSGLSPEKMALLDSLPEDTSASDIATKLGIDGEEVDQIRASKLAPLIQEMAGELNKD